MMNINNLKDGQIIKNYKELCEVLKIKQTTGRGKQTQLEELKLYCNYHKEGYKFIIDKVIDKPVITLDEILKNKNSKYITLLSNIILEYLYNKPNELSEIPLFRFIELLGITNYNYKSGNTYKKELSQLYDIQIASIYYFYSNTKNEFRRLIERCLNNLQKRSVLFWSKCVIIVENHFDEKGKRYTTTRKATKEESEEILNIQREAIKYLNFNSMYEVMKDKQALKQFNNILNKELGFNYFLAYDLIIGDRAIKIEYEETIKKETNKLMVNKTYNMFATDKFKSFYTDYEKLIELLIYKDNKMLPIEETLKDKRKDNIKNYNKETSKLNKEYESKLEEINSKYLE